MRCRSSGFGSPLHWRGWPRRGGGGGGQNGVGAGLGGGMLRHERRGGCALGLLLFLAFWLQIEGLARTSRNRNAFVTGLNVLVVQLIPMALWGRRYGWRRG